jgi:opacity protein-like surface antigen
MNVRTRRALARAGTGALALFATGTLVSLASPAQAADASADVAVNVASTKLAVGAPGKLLRVDINNNGPAVATDTVVTVDVSGLQTDKVVADFSGLGDGCEVTKTTLTCELGDGKAGETFDLGIPLTRLTDKVGPAGSLTVEVTSAVTDRKPENNKSTVQIEVAESGADVVVDADDVYAVDSKGNPTNNPVPPGDASILNTFILNLGDIATDGLKFTASLPEHVSFLADGDYDFCTYSADRRTADCKIEGYHLVPLDQEDPENEVYGLIGVPFLVGVAADAPGPITPRGTFSASALGEVSPPARSTLAKVELPEGVKGLSKKAAEDTVKDVDEGDNSDEFTVFIGAAPETGGQGGGLPVTGVQVGLISGIGGGVLAVGAVLFVMARRRRVVLVTPGDETPTV